LIKEEISVLTSFDQNAMFQLETVNSTSVTSVK